MSNNSRGSGVTIRLADPDDAAAIRDVHVSDVDQWFRWAPDGTRTPVTYDELTPTERWLHGGAWMDPTSCRAHLERVLESGSWPLLAERDGQTVGNMEVIVGPDRDWGKSAHVDILQVRRDAQRSGVGRALVGEGLKLATEASCQMYTTQPDKTAIDFYAKCGLKDVLVRQLDLKLSLEGVSETESLEMVKTPIRSFDFLHPLSLAFGRFQSSYSEWIKGTWAEAEVGSRRIVEETYVPSIQGYCRLWQQPRHTRSAFLYSWTNDTAHLREVLLTFAVRAKKMGYDFLETTVEPSNVDRLQDVGATIGPEGLILGRPLGLQ